MAVENRVINHALAHQLSRKSEMLKRIRAGEPAAVESFPRATTTITGLCGYWEGKKYLEELSLVAVAKRRAGCPVELQGKWIFFNDLLLDHHRNLKQRG